MREKVIKEAQALEERLTSMSDAIYRHPETAYEEFKTSALLRRFFEERAFNVEEGVGGVATAFRALWGSGKPVVALLAEMDALPGIGHGCGHNLIGPASAGAAAVLSKVLLPEQAGTVLVLGTPAEEDGGGKIQLLDAGLFRDVDCAMMVHPSSRRKVTKYFIGLVRMTCTFTGRSSHASAYPEEGINALDGVVQTFNNVNALRQQLRSDVRIHGVITDGGRVPNIIPERASASFYVRAGDREELAAVKERFLNCVRGAATATGCQVTIKEESDSNAPMKISRTLAGIYRDQLDYLGLEEEQNSPDDRNLGSSDIGNVSQVVPTIHPLVPMRKGINIHTSEFAEATVSEDGHRALMEGVTTLALTALEVMTNPAALEAVKEEFARNDATP